MIPTPQTLTTAHNGSQRPTTTHNGSQRPPDTGLDPGRVYKVTRSGEERSSCVSGRRVLECSARVGIVRRVPGHRDDILDTVVTRVLEITS